MPRVSLLEMVYLNQKFLVITSTVNVLVASTWPFSISETDLVCHGVKQYPTAAAQPENSYSSSLDKVCPV